MLSDEIAQDSVRVADEAREVREEYERLRRHAIASGSIQPGCTCGTCSTRERSLSTRAVDIVSARRARQSQRRYEATTMPASMSYAAVLDTSRSTAQMQPTAASVPITVRRQDHNMCTGIRVRIGVDDIFGIERQSVIDSLVRVELAALDYFRIARCAHISVERSMQLCVDAAAWDFAMFFRWSATGAAASSIDGDVRRVLNAANSMAPMLRVVVFNVLAADYESWGAAERRGVVGTLIHPALEATMWLNGLVAASPTPAVEHV